MSLCSALYALFPVGAAAQQLCSPFDAIPASNVSSGGRMADVAACCDGEATDEGCGPCRCAECGDEPAERNIGRPVDVLNQFAWLERTDTHLAMPNGPALLMGRTYSTHWAQSKGGRDEIGRLGPGWTDTYGARLVFDGNSPPQVVTYRKADTGTENFTRQQDGSYAGRMPGRRLVYDSGTQRWVMEKFDASTEVFDALGQLVLLRAPDGGEAQLVYADGLSCPVTAARPAGVLCRVDFLFGHQLWFSYHATAWPGATRLAAVSRDAAGTQPLVQYAYNTGGYLVTVTQPDNRQEHYAYAFTHAFPRYPGATVKLLTSATDGVGALVESFTYHQEVLGQSRVTVHENPEGRYTFSAGRVLSTSSVRTTHVRSTRENLDYTWEGGKLKTVCHSNAQGCDSSRIKEVTVPATGIQAATCERGFDGFYTRYLRDALGRRTSTLRGLASCASPTDQELAHEVFKGYVANSNRDAYTARKSVDTTVGTQTFSVNDYTAHSAAVDPLCGNASCQVPTAYNTPASALTSQVQQRVRFGRTLGNTNGTWVNRMEVTKFTYNSQGLLTQKDGPLPGTADTLTYEYYDVLGPQASAGRLKRILHGTRVLTEYQDYDALGRAQRILNESGQATVQTFDAMGRILTAQGPDDTQPTVLTYTAAGKQQEVKLPSGARLIYSHNTLGQMTSVGVTSTPSGTPPVFDEEITYEWGTALVEAGRMLSESYSRDGAVVRTTRYGYDDQGRKAEIRYMRTDGQDNERAAVHLSTFDEDGHLTTTEVGVSSVTEGSETDAPTNHIYDQLQRLSQVTRGDYVTQNLLYDVHHNLAEVNETSVFGSGTPRMRYKYDDFGRLVEVTSITLGTRRYVYDEAGNRVQELVPTGEVLTTAYDARGRALSITGPDYSVSFTHDTDAASMILDCATGTALGASQGMGRLTAVTEPSGNTYFGYTVGGRPRFEARVAPGATCAKTMRWEYNTNGTFAALRYPSGARIRYDYPTGVLHARELSAMVLEVGASSIPLTTGLVWSGGGLRAYSAGNGLMWSLSRWMDGAPREWKLTQGPGGALVRNRVFGEEVNGTLEPRVNGRGSPNRIEENVPAWTRGYTYEPGTGRLMIDSSPDYVEQYLYTTDDNRSFSFGSFPQNSGMSRTSSYTYNNSNNSRLSSVSTTESPSGPTTTRTFTYSTSGMVTQVNTGGRLAAMCYDSREQVGAVVGPGGQYSRQHFNYRRQRVREVWPLNELVTDYWVDSGGSLLVETGAASLTTQYPRPVWEYVYLNGMPVARVDSVEAVNGTTTYQGVTWLFGGHLGELLVEADADGHVIRNYDYSSFGARTARPTPAVPSNVVLSRAAPSTQVVLPASASAVLRFTNYALASCDSVAVVDAEGHLLKRLSASQSAQFETASLPAQGASIQVVLEPGACAGPSSFTLAEVKPTWGRASETVLTGHASPHPYPAAGSTTTLSLSSPSHLLVESHLADCDSLEVRRSVTGEVLWTWPHDGGVLRTAWTPELSGSVDVGIWSSAGCNQGQQQAGFAVLRQYTRQSPGAASNLHYPGQRKLVAAANTRRGAFMEPEADLLENWFRVYEPGTGRYMQPEPLASVVPGMSLGSTYGYADNNPLGAVDPTGLFTLSPGAPICNNWDEALKLARKKAGCDGGCKKCKTPCDVCQMLQSDTYPIVYLIEVLQNTEHVNDTRVKGRVTIQAHTDYWKQMSPIIYPQTEELNSFARGIWPGMEEGYHYTVAFKKSLCNKPVKGSEYIGKDNLENLAMAMLHESIHMCMASGIVSEETLDDRPLSLNSPWTTDTQDVVDQCWKQK
ncbi:RHS repeat protein [Archangium primigenium]|uniref:RHS repeat protein n=1 Tax=[Archangium] primigenium TaxID=2792470 RepID=UPI001958DCF3|nr:RHS repeat-associated core domain-containing protein [Archangium primigenium]MBM7112985.1 hypothetical protein [Archangium primigenium]